MTEKDSLEEDLINDEISAFDVLVIGNGFDLHLKQKTAYDDFHTIFKCVFEKTNISSKSTIIEELKNLDFECINQNYADKLIDLIFSNKNNFYLQYFSNAKYGEWNEFEKQLEKIYITLDSMLVFLSNYISSDSNYNYVLIKDMYELPAFHIFDYVKEWNGFSFGTSSAYPNCGIFIDKTSNLRGINRGSYKERVNNLKKEIPQMLFKDLELFSYMFQLYLAAFTHVEYLRCKELKVKKLITYNYTAYAEKILEPETALYLHGKLDLQEDAEEIKNTIIFGVDEKTSFVNTGFERFKKTIIRSLYETDISRLSFHIHEVMLNRGVYDYGPSIGIIGHSLDLIDEDSLKMILDNDFMMYYVFYYDDEGRFNVTYNLKSILGQNKYNQLFNNNQIRYIQISALKITKEDVM